MMLIVTSDTILRFDAPLSNNIPSRVRYWLPAIPRGLNRLRGNAGNAATYFTLPEILSREPGVTMPLRAIRFSPMLRRTVEVALQLNSEGRAHISAGKEKERCPDEDGRD